MGHWWFWDGTMWYIVQLTKLTHKWVRNRLIVKDKDKQVIPNNIRSALQSQYWWSNSVKYWATTDLLYSVIIYDNIWDHYLICMVCKFISSFVLVQILNQQHGTHRDMYNTRTKVSHNIIIVTLMHILILTRMHADWNYSFNIYMRKISWIVKAKYYTSAVGTSVMHRLEWRVFCPTCRYFHMPTGQA